MKEFDMAGLWSLPEAPDSQVVGHLAYTPESGFTLKIPFGHLGDIDHAFRRINHEGPVPIVNGILRNGKRATLLDCLLTNTSVNFPGGATEEYRSSLGFFGDVNCSANPLIDRVTISYSHLRDWVVWHPITATQLLDGDELGKDISYHYEAPADRELASGDGWQMLLRASFQRSYPSVKGFHLNHDWGLVINFSRPVSFGELETNFLGSIWQFFSFCLNKNVNQQRLTIRLAGDESWFDVGRAASMFPSKDEVIMQPFMLLPMSTIEPILNEVLERWLRMKGDERRAVALLIGLSGGLNIPTDLRFLAAVQALEAFSRVDTDPYELTSDEFQRRVSIVLEANDDAKVREWAERKLRFVNRKPLSALLDNLVSQIGDYVVTLAPDRKRFLDDIRNNRNFYTHRDDTRARNILAGGELYILTEGIICLLKATILRKIFWFSEDETKAIMDDCQGTIQWKIRVAEQYGTSNRSV